MNRKIKLIPIPKPKSQTNKGRKSHGIRDFLTPIPKKDHH